MLPVDRVRAIVHRALESGETHTEAIRDVVANEIEQEANVRELCRTTADKLVSLVVATERDDVGDRMAFPSRDPEGERIIVHLKYTDDAGVLRYAGIRRVKQGKRRIEEGRRMIARADQLEIDFPAPTAA